MYIYLQSSTAYTNIMPSVLCKKKKKAIVSQIPCCGGAAVCNQLEYLRAMCLAISVGTCGMVQPLTVAMT